MHGYNGVMFVHEHPDFEDLISKTAHDRGASPALVFFNYWNMHILSELKQKGHVFYVNGGTSLALFDIVHRLSDDLDLGLKPPADIVSGHRQDSSTGPSRRGFFENLEIKIHGANITLLQDKIFYDVPKYRGIGIKIDFARASKEITGRLGVTADFRLDDSVETNPDLVTMPIVSSWLFDAAQKAGWNVQDNRAHDIKILQPDITMLAKTRAIAAGFAKEQEGKVAPVDFIRHYHDLYHLLKDASIQETMTLDAFKDRKHKTLHSGTKNITEENPAFHLHDPELRQRYESAYEESKLFYDYDKKVSFDEIINFISTQAGTILKMDAVPENATQPKTPPTKHRIDKNNPHK